MTDVIFVMVQISLFGLSAAALGLFLRGQGGRSGRSD